MVKFTTKLLAAAIILFAAPLNSGLALVANHDELFRHPANARLAKILAENNLTNINAPVEKTPVGAVPQKNVCLRKPDKFVAATEPAYFAIYEKEAKVAGIDPVVLYAIAWHETGGFKSPLWVNGNNPGGLEYHQYNGMKTSRWGKSGRYCVFESKEDGIRAHALVLSKPLYHRARETNDPFRQVEYISDAGYAEHNQGWLTGVKKFVARFTGRAGDFLVAMKQKIHRKKKRHVGMTVD